MRKRPHRAGALPSIQGTPEVRSVYDQIGLRLTHSWHQEFCPSSRSTHPQSVPGTQNASRPTGLTPLGRERSLYLHVLRTGRRYPVRRYVRPAPGARHSVRQCVPVDMESTESACLEETDVREVSCCRPLGHDASPDLRGAEMTVGSPVAGSLEPHSILSHANSKGQGNSLRGLRAPAGRSPQPRIRTRPVRTAPPTVRPGYARRRKLTCCRSFRGLKPSACCAIITA